MSNTKKRYSPEQKMKIVREHLENHVPVGELAARCGIHPSLIHLWKKELFESATEVFGSKSVRTNQRQIETITQLEQKLKDKDSLISELVEDNIQLKKKYNGAL